MQGIKKFLLIIMLVPLATGSLRAKGDGIAIETKTDLAVAGVSFVAYAYIAWLAIKTASAKYGEVTKKCTKKPKTAEGKELQSAWLKAVSSVAGMAGAWTFGRLLKKAYEQTGVTNGGVTNKNMPFAPIFNQL